LEESGQFAFDGDVPGLSARPVANPRVTNVMGSSGNVSATPLAPGTAEYYQALIRQSRDGVGQALRCVNATIARSREGIERSTHRLGILEELYQLDINGKTSTLKPETSRCQSRRKFRSDPIGESSTHDTTSVDFDFHDTSGHASSAGNDIPFETGSDDDDGSDGDGESRSDSAAEKSLWEREVQDSQMDEDSEASS